MPNKTRKLTQEEKRAWAVVTLQQRAIELGRLPRKSDFESGTTARIKAFLGPWPRALESAGLKQPKEKRE